MNRRSLAVLAVLLSACSRERTAPDIDSSLASEIGGIRAIDNHAHPVRVTAKGEPPDRFFDALPVDHMEPESDPLPLRDDSPGLPVAWRALFNAVDLKQKQSARDRLLAGKGDAYPAWVLDQMGVEVMLANRVAMGPSIQPPRFRWVPYADALIFPLDNSALAATNPDRKAFFALEDNLRARYLKDAGLAAPPAALADYLSKVVTPTLERQRAGGAVAEKFEAAYLRSLRFDKVDRATADRVYAQFRTRTPPDADYKSLQDFLFRYIALECGRLGMLVHIHTMAGAGGYFDVAGANPLNLEPLFNDPDLRRTKFVMVHGGWPFNAQVPPLLEKPNVWIDISAQDLMLTPATLARSLREWLEWVPEKILFGTDAYPYSDGMGWEESGWLATGRGREALAIALTAMMRDGEISRDRAAQLAKMVLRENARSLYGL